MHNSLEKKHERMRVLFIMIYVKLLVYEEGQTKRLCLF